MQRKLASIQKVIKIQPIEKADRIEKITILGWEVVCRKNEFKEGDLVVYCEVDSILPDKSEFEFLRERKFRIRTVKLKKQVSQGICFPLSILPKGKYAEGDDVTDILGIKKYDPQLIAEDKMLNESASKSRNAFDRMMRRYNWYRRLTIKITKLPFPSFIRKTDEDRIQLFPNICENHKDTIFQMTEKIDGCLSENTLITTDRGIKTIKEICEKKIKCKVLAYDIFSEEKLFVKIKGYRIQENNNDWFELEYSDKKIILTGEHKVYLPKLHCYRQVKDLDGTESFLVFRES